MGSWSSPVTNRLLLEARGMSFCRHPDEPDEPNMTQVIEQAGLFPGFTYRGSGWSRTDQPNIHEFHGAARCT